MFIEFLVFSSVGDPLAKESFLSRGNSGKRWWFYYKNVKCLLHTCFFLPPKFLVREKASILSCLEIASVNVFQLPDLPVWGNWRPDCFMVSSGSAISLTPQSGRNITIWHICSGFNQVLEKQTLPNARLSSARAEGSWLPCLSSWVRH